MDLKSSLGQTSKVQSLCAVSQLHGNRLSSSAELQRILTYVSLGKLRNPTRTSGLLSFQRNVTGVDHVTHRLNTSCSCLLLHKRLMEHNHTHGFTNFLRLLSYVNGQVEKLHKRPYGSQGLKYLSSCLYRKSLLTLVAQEYLPELILQSSVSHVDVNGTVQSFRSQNSCS